MTLQIVWRNPFPPTQPKFLVENIVQYERETLYIFRGEAAEFAFEVVHGGDLLTLAQSV